MKTVQVIATYGEENKCWETTQCLAESIQDPMHVINVYPEIEKQKIEGFGGAFTEASAHNYSKLSEEKKNQFIDAYFSQEGLGYNMARVHMNSCDFALGNYTYVEEGDDALETFDISHDFEQIIPMIKAAQKKSPQTIKWMVSPWSPPAFMKTTGEMNNGGKLKKEYYEAWARYFVKFIKAYEEAGVPISYVTVQNEPMAVQTWDSCIYTGEEEGCFAGTYLGPILKEAGLGHVKLFVWDHNKEELLDRAQEVMAQKDADTYVNGFAIHWYTGDHFEAIELTKTMYPEQEIIFTEGCVEYSRFADSGEVDKAEMYAHDMMGNLKAGINGFIDWNLLLDEKGGPNHVGNFCAAPIMCTGDEREIEKRLPYYYIGHLSKYIKRGAKVIGTTQYTHKLEVLGCINPDGERVVVVLNRSNETIDISLREKGMGIYYKVKPRSIYTFVYK